MDLYFLRHGIAVEPGFSSHPEEERPLTSEGIREMSAIALGMQALSIVPKILISSPLTRARQTAEIVREGLKLKSNIEIRSFLAPGGSFQDFLKELRRRPETSFLCVGHEPTLSLWIQQLLGCGGETSVAMNKGTLAHLQLEWEGPRPIAQLLALLQPWVLSRMK